MSDNVHRMSRKQEERMAKKIGGQRNPGSGNQWARKNDVRNESLSMELKTTNNRQFTLKDKELINGERNALADGRDFAFGIEMSNRTWVVISEEDFLMYRAIVDLDAESCE